jgi:hypothetical protein
MEAKMGIKSFVRKIAKKAIDKALDLAFGAETEEPPRVHGTVVPEPVVTKPEPVVTTEPAPVAAPPEQPTTPPSIAATPEVEVKEVAPTPAPKPVKGTRTCANAGKPEFDAVCVREFNPRDPRHAYCHPCARAYQKAKAEKEAAAKAEADRRREALEAEHKRELEKLTAIQQYKEGKLPAEAQVTKNGAQVVIKLPVIVAGAKVLRSFTFVDEGELARIRAAKNRAKHAPPPRPKSPEQIREEKLAEAKAKAEEARKAADDAKAEAERIEQEAKVAEVKANAAVSDEGVDAFLQAYDLAKTARSKSDELELKAQAAEEEFAKLAAPPEPKADESEPKGKDKGGKGGGKGDKNKGDKNKNGNGRDKRAS